MTLHTHLNRDIPEATLDALVARHPFGRYCEDVTLPLDTSRQHVGRVTRAFLDSADAAHIEAVDATGQTVGLVLFRLSSWDTEHFGYPCAIVESVLIADGAYGDRRAIADGLAARLRAWLLAHDVRFTSARVSARDLAVVHSLEQHGFRFIESWVFNSRSTKNAVEPDDPLPLRPARPSDEAYMLEYSKDAFETQRFHADPHIERSQADGLYESWIATSFRDPRMQTLVYEEHARPVASMTYYTSDLSNSFGLKFVMWKMALTDPEIRGRGVGTRLFRSLLHHHAAHGFDVVDSGLSLRNVVSLNLHNKCGFRVTCTQLTMHLWLNHSRP